MKEHKVFKELEELKSKLEFLEYENEYLHKALNYILTSKFGKLLKIYCKLKTKIPSFLSINKNRNIKLIKLLRNIVDSRTFVYPPTIHWNTPLYQRPHHFAIELCQKGYNYVFCSPCIRLEGIREAEMILPRLILTENWEDVISYITDGILILPSTNSNVSIDLLMELKSKGWTIIYDYIDEISDIITKNSHFQRKRHRKLRPDIIDIVCCVSLNLLNEVKSRFPKEKILYLPNACDYEHFRVKKEYSKIPVTIKPLVEMKRPIIGYYGALAKWIDYELINYIAEKRKEYILLLIGVDYDGSFKHYKFPSNVIIHPPVSYRILPKYAIWFDVSIIPFKEGSVARSTSPIKLFEYMALGKPTVCTKSLSECSLYKTPLIAIDKEDFLEKLDQALELSTNTSFLELILEEAQENTWKARIEKLLTKLEEIGD